MKKFILLAAAVAAMALTSCVSVPKFTQVAYALDYQKAGKGRVFITESNSVNFDYEPIASLVVVEEEGKSVSKVEIAEEKGDEVYGPQSTIKVKTKGWRDANLYSALEFAVEQCEKMGGDGIINLRNRTITNSVGHVTSVEVTGMVIRRK